MNRWCEMVQNFREKFEKPVPENLTAQEQINLIALRKRLIAEEAGETLDALCNLYEAIDNESVVAIHNARVEVLDGICDSIVVLIGTAQALGMDLERAMEQVYWSNMSKLGDDGKPIYRQDGKVLKGPHFTPPYLDNLV